MVNQNILHYKILEKLGGGGMGVVYKAEDTKLKRTVALKFLPPHVLATTEEKSRFIHEAQAAASLHHPNICTIYEINEADEKTFIAMAYLEGQGLNEKIREDRLEPLHALTITIQLARGLQAAHERGIVHRDIKSSNVMIGKDNRATIMDFGLAKSAHQKHSTQRGTKMGTIGYMSPEQARGEDVDHRTDIWSLGVLLYEMVTGQRPFRGEYDEAVIYSILNEEPKPATSLVGDLPPDIQYIIGRAIAKNPDDRYQTATEMLVDLDLLHEAVKNGSSDKQVVGPSSSGTARGQVTSALFATRSLVSLIVYLAAAWVVVKVIGWSVNRFVLSPHLVSIAMVALLSLIPSVWILAARNGARTRVWRMVTRIGVPANIVASVLVLFAVFAGRDIGAATETVAVQDESGEIVERVVPKDEFRKSLLLYAPRNESGDGRYDWGEAAIGTLLEIDLWQDQFLWLRSSADDAARHRLQRAGFSTWSEAPWNLKREMAESANVDYLVTGSFTIETSDSAELDELGGVSEDAVWEITLRTHDSHSGRLVGQSVHRGSDLFTLVDEASVQIKRDIDIPTHHIDTTTDLPVSAMVTSSMPALASFSKGIDQAFFKLDWYASIPHLERAAEYDSTFAYAYCLLYASYVLTNRGDQRDVAMKAAMRHLYKLPERLQTLMKAEYYGFMEQPEKVLGVLQMMIELYPHDIDARVHMARVRADRGERDLVIEQFKEILAIDPSRTEFLQAIARSYREKSDFENAIAYYLSYSEKHPYKSEAFHNLGTTYEVMGDYDRAREYYEKALVIDPSLSRVLVDLGDIHAKLAEDASALEMFGRALAMSVAPQDRARVHRSLRGFYSNRGMMDKSIEHLKLMWAEYEKYMSPAVAQVRKLEDVCLFVRGGRTDEAFSEMESIRAQLSPPIDGLVPLGYLCIYAELEDAAEAEKALRGLESFIDTHDYEVMRGWIFWGQARIDELRGDYEAAIDNYQENFELNPGTLTAHSDIGRCYRRLGKCQKTVEAIEMLLKVYPNNPKANYEMALAYHEMGDQEKAMKCLHKALAVWKNADPVYEPAKKARATLEEWGS
ncbi:MAG: serine/threonine-protein kinase [Candidatus Krumholzibacteria bacterium]|nr:serine/threonine-protein kinase [Candidatus Krumholzibacteria bacterium]